MSNNNIFNYNNRIAVTKLIICPMVKKYYAYLLLGKIFPKTKLGNVLLKLK